MAKKKDNTLLYAGIAAAAILLLKKKDTGMAGVGEKIIVADYFDPKTGYMEYEVNGKQYWVQGEHYYNRRKERYEHTHYDPRGGEYLIVVHR